MSQFLKVTGESMWINLDRVDGVIVRPELRAVGVAHGEGSLEELHESTGTFEVAVYFQGQLVPVISLPSKEAAEEAVLRLIGPKIVE